MATSLVGNLYYGEVHIYLFIFPLTRSFIRSFTGFGSAFFAVLYSGVFYWLYASAITELAARYRTSGGSFDFVKAAMGKKYAALMVPIFTHRSLIRWLTCLLIHSGGVRATEINISECGIGFIHLVVLNFCRYSI